MITFQDFEKETNIPEFIGTAISAHMRSENYKIAKSADNYDHQKNELIYDYVRLIFTLTGSAVEDFTASNNKIASNFFHRLNTQRCTYLLGNGVSFTEHKKDVVNDDGIVESIDTTKELLGKEFDTDLKDLAYNGLIHGLSFGFWDMDKLHVFPLTEFVPFWDENTGVLRAGIRFWQLDKNKPTIAVLYEEDGYTKYKAEGIGFKFVEFQPKSAYKIIVSKTDADGETVIGEDNYSALPIIPLWGSRLKQSTLVGMKSSIDSFDLIRSGFANDLSDCAQIYWILENCGGMSDAEVERFRDRLKLNHIAVVDTDNSGVTPYTQEIPHNARQVYLDMIRSGIYEDFGGLDVHTVAAGATNDHIDAAYQPMDEEADDFEYQIIKFIQQLLKLINVEDTPQFKRNRISNQKEQTDMILSVADYLDDETILSKLPFISVDEISKILIKKDQTELNRFENESNEPNEDDDL